MNQLFYLALFINVAALPLILDSLLRAFLIIVRLVGRGGIQLPPAPLAKGESGGAILLIAARDEEGTIGETVESLLPMLGEWVGSQLWIVADHCTDGTGDEAAAAGATVARRSSGPQGKGAVIEWWLESHRDIWKDYPAIVILDADSRLAPGSLGRLKEAIGSGADAAQAFVAPLASTRTGRLAGWSEVLMQEIDDRARLSLNWPVPLRGTGMAVRSPLLAELAPRLHTQAEDLELDILLAIRDCVVRFVPEAILYDPKPLQATGASRQRARWLKGQLDVLRDYHRELASLLKPGRRRSRSGDLFLLVLLFLRPKILFIALRMVLLPLLPLTALVGLVLDATYYLAGALFVDRPVVYLRDLFAVPLYFVMWGRSLLIALLTRGRQLWLRAGRWKA
ncbi:MAG: glycosyltransferase family 2 protein [Acidobacteriota bacterium]